MCIRVSAEFPTLTSAPTGFTRMKWDIRRWRSCLPMRFERDSKWHQARLRRWSSSETCQRVTDPMRHSASSCHRIAAATALATAITFGVSGCGGSPTTPPAVTNTPPTIDSLVVAGTRVEADQPIAITATVRDVETPVNQLTYTWSASPATGTFTGTGSAVTWRPAKGAKTPDLYTVTLTVTESYTSAGQAKQNSVSMSATVHYNDSQAEASAVAYDFLVYKFGNFDVKAAEAVSNFSDSTQRQPDGKICSDEKADE